MISSQQELGTPALPLPSSPSASSIHEDLRAAAANRGRARIHTVFVLRTMPPYRIPFLSSLAIHSPALDLTVVAAEGASERGKLPSVSTPLAFRVVRASGRTLEVWKFTLVWIRFSLSRLRALAPDVLVLEGSFGIISHVPLALWARLTGRKVVFWVAGHTKPSTTGAAKWLRESYMRAALRLGHQFVAYSSSAAKWLVRLGATENSVRVAQNSIDVDRIAANSEGNAAAAAMLRTKLGIGDAPVIMYVGALARDKRVERVLALHERLRAQGTRVHTVIVGDGPERETLQPQAMAMDGVHLVGRIVEGVDAYFALGDLFVLPGLGGLAINQAMASGTPVLCTTADGTERDLIVEGITGHYRPDFDVGEWAELATSILTDPQRKQRMGAAAKSHVLRTASLTGMCDVFCSSVAAAFGAPTTT